ncbi:DnaJ C-terminal domain-containing protein [Parvularcula lutaonensis]|uniref:DnaJ C-terminal domain-containing protein n=1 Tax=Parvularcula lutaonensis TaxID=491923 RepID=A0ABV7MEA9_9PROT|nr:DnaJ C-terminal domain-containing protein [Parvularcula lutaonensis]GGY53266.1 molecular chaperone DnaJ [Parvularcula lutaonensis]
MAKDPYTLLGVGRQASQDEIRSAYRKLAKQYHPDRNQGDKAAEEKFKAVTAAWEILGDEEKRKRFDRGEIDADGNERSVFGQGGPFGGVDPAEAAERFARRARPGRGGFEDFSDIFSDFFGRGDAGPRHQPRAQKGRDVRTRLTVPFLDAARGSTKRVMLPGGSTVNVTIPEGLRDGQTLRLKGKGHPGVHGGPDGDLFVEVSVAPDPTFEVKGDDVHTVVPLPLKQAVLGGKLDVPTLTGRATIKIPPNTSSGKAFRLKGKGLRKGKSGEYGDLFARVHVMLPETPDRELEAFMKRWEPADAGAEADDFAATG